MECGQIVLEIFIDLNHLERITNLEVKELKIGKFIRAHSLDELPQIWDIFIEDSGIIGTTKKNLDFTRVLLAQSNLVMMIFLYDCVD